jgi:LysM repeat protein
MSSKAGPRFPRAVAIAAVIAPLALLTACGDSETGARTTMVELDTTNYVVREPATTTTTLPDGGVATDEEGRSLTEQTYEIQSGDFPLGVADRFGITLDELVNYNGWGSASQFPFPGTVIKIPPNALVVGASTSSGTDTSTDTGTDTDTDTGTASGTTTTLPPAGECTPGSHTIAAGDIPITVAEQYDVTLAQLNAANASTSGYQAFIVGTVIVIPCAD